MKNKILIFTAGLLVIGSLACQAAYRLVLSPTATPTFLPTEAVLPSGTPTFTLEPPTSTPEPTIIIELATTTPNQSNPTDQITPTPTHLPQSLQLSVFKDLWQTVKDNYLYPDFNGLDWEAVYDEYTAKIETGMTNDEFYKAMSEAVFRLGDDHSVFLSPEMVAKEEQDMEGNFDYVGIGALIQPFPDLNRAVILVVFPDSPAEKAGLKSRDSILTVDGAPILNDDGSLKNILRGKEGTDVTITVESPGEQPRELTITRGAISSPMPVPSTVLVSPEGKRIGYLFVTSFFEGTVDESIAEEIQKMSIRGRLDGLIIDNRENGGGTSTVLRPVLSYFTKGVVGYFISHDGEDPLNLRSGENIFGSQEIPLVVLVGDGTASFGEIFAGVLKDLGRAYIIGVTTGGNVETLFGYDFEDGSRAWIAHESFRPLNHPNEDWEKTGIIPDLTVDANWILYPVETDPAVLAALEHFDKQ